MTAADGTSVLKRMMKATAPAVADVPLTASRAVKLALTRSAEASIGLVLTVEKVSEEAQSLDDLLASLADDMVLLWLDKQGEHAGILALDKDLSSAIVEIRTTSRIREAGAPDRRASAADVALAQPLFAGLFNELNATTSGTVLEGWIDQISAGDRVASVRAASLALPEDRYRHMTVEVDLGVGGRKGVMRLALPNRNDTPRDPVVGLVTTDWAQEMEDTVMEAPAMLEAILHRAHFPLSLLADLKVGQELPLRGCKVSSVKLEALDGTFIGRGRIGQMGGNIAVRLETPEAIPMLDLGADGGLNSVSDIDSPAALPSDTFPIEPAFDAPPMLGGMSDISDDLPAADLDAFLVPEDG